MTALLDTGFLLAVIDADDDLHSSCVAALHSESQAILPDVVLPELSYLILRELGHSVLASFLRAIVAMAERMDVSKILTVDRRHFTIFRPKHREYFEIAP